MVRSREVWCRALGFGVADGSSTVLSKSLYTTSTFRCFLWYCAVPSTDFSTHVKESMKAMTGAGTEITLCPSRTCSAPALSSLRFHLPFLTSDVHSSVTCQWRTTSGNSLKDSPHHIAESDIVLAEHGGSNM